MKMDKEPFFREGFKVLRLDTKEIKAYNKKKTVLTLFLVFQLWEIWVENSHSNLILKTNFKNAICFKIFI